MKSLLILLERGIEGRSDRIAAITATAVTAEALVFCGNGRRCPLTGVVERLGARGRVTDIYLPRWIADRIFELTAPVFVLALGLQARNLLMRPAPRPR